MILQVISARIVEIAELKSMTVAGLKFGPDRGSNRAPRPEVVPLSTTVMLHPSMIGNSARYYWKPNPESPTYLK